MPSKTQLTNQQIIAAALTVAAEQGAGKVTLEAVAKAAGVSKGGLIYHFPNKEALISAMVQQLLAEVNQSRLDLLAQDASLLRAVIQARATCSKNIQTNTAMAILAAAASQPELLKPLQQHNQYVLDALKQQYPQPEALMLVLASEALVFQDLLDISPFSQQERAELEQYLINRAQELSI